MTALSKFLVLLALFLLASHANALSLVARNQVWVNHLIQLRQPMSNPIYKPSNEPISEPFKWIDLNAELSNNLLLPYSEPKQDAALPIKNTDLTNTQTCGLCHNKKQSQNL
jgi:hypothetical protein